MSTPTPPKSSTSNIRKLTPPKVLTTIRSMHLRRNAPPPIPIPINPIRHNLEIGRPKRPPKLSTLPVTPSPQSTKASYVPPPLTGPFPTPKPETRPKEGDVVAVELSNYSPSLTREDVIKLFGGFEIAPDVVMSSTTKFAYPLRTIIHVKGREEADKAVRELDGTVVGNRRIRVALAERAVADKENETGHGEMREEDEEVAKVEKETEVVVEEMADELKIGIIHAAHTYYPHLAPKVLQVREYSDGTACYAFLQAREPSTTTETAVEAALAQLESTARWEFVTGGRVDSRSSQKHGKSGRLAALKKLQETVEEQGMLKKVWSQWNGQL